MTSLCETFGLTWHGAPEMRVDWGGPVQPELGWMLLGEGGLDVPEVESVTEGIRFTRSNEVLREVAQNPPRQLRMFLGYAGWGPGQLERELAQGALREPGWWLRYLRAWFSKWGRRVSGTAPCGAWESSRPRWCRRRE
jgi:putative AlgH/UPF0301 family transcriptional regulator